ncbi:MAG: glycosyltransferase family 2 protein [Hyphomicrobiales bacterium]
MSVSKKIPITVVVPIKNEKANLARCLAQLDRFDEVVVVDSSSDDSSPEIAAQFDCRVLNFEWDGHYPKKRNWVLLNHKLANDWVLFLDADEIVDDEFCDAALRAITSNTCNGYWLNYTNYFLNKRLRYGLPQRKLALFRASKGLYEKIDEDGWSALDMEIHEHPIIEGSIGEIKAPIEHNDFQGLAKFIERHNNYAQWEARRAAKLKSSGEEASQHLTRRQRNKYKNLERWWFPWIYFCYVYFIRLGFLDGKVGFHYAYYKAWYFSTIRLLITAQ